MSTIYDFQATLIDGTNVSLEAYRGQVLLIVNVASKCSFTVQYTALEEVYRKYQARGFVILAFPCNQFLYQEPGSNSDIQAFCENRYQVTFPVFAKVDVNGPHAHPLFTFLKQSKAGWLGIRRIGWNFSKFLIDRRGNVVRRFSTMTTPQAIEPDIERLLENVTIDKRKT